MTQQEDNQQSQLMGVYSFNSPERLYERLLKLRLAFNEMPSDELVMDMVFPLYHLREWICPGGYDSFRHKPKEEYTKEEILHVTLHHLPEYEVIREMCNAAKHYQVEKTIESTRVLKRSIAGLVRAGDRLGQTYYFINGRDLRDFINPVLKVYSDYFKETQKS